MNIKITFKKNGEKLCNDLSNHCATYLIHADAMKHALWQLDAVLAYSRSQKPLDDNNSPLLTVKQLQINFNISERTSRRLRSAGKLPFIKSKRRILFDPKSVTHFLEIRKR